MIVKTLKILTTLLFVFFAGCINTTPTENDDDDDDDDNYKVTASAACNECHTYPGSNMCKLDTVVVNGKSATQCFGCHKNSVIFDSSKLNDTSNSYVYYDKMFLQNGKSFPKTGPHHADHALSLEYSQCTACHSNPPNSGAHLRHMEEGKQCVECHFQSVKSELIVDEVNPAFNYTDQVHQRAPGGALLPVPIADFHMNKRVDVAFMRNYDSPKIATPFTYNKFDNSCSNIECHSDDIANGGALKAKSYWKAASE